MGTSRTITVDGFAVLKDNDYSLEDVRSIRSPPLLLLYLKPAASHCCCLFARSTVRPVHPLGR